jgi:hypothetical protein
MPRINVAGSGRRSRLAASLVTGGARCLAALALAVPAAAVGAWVYAQPSPLHTWYPRYMPFWCLLPAATAALGGIVLGGGRRVESRGALLATTARGLAVGALAASAPTAAGLVAPGLLRPQPGWPLTSPWVLPQYVRLLALLPALGAASAVLIQAYGPHVVSGTRAGWSVLLEWARAGARAAGRWVAPRWAGTVVFAFFATLPWWGFLLYRAGRRSARGHDRTGWVFFSAMGRTALDTLEASAGLTALHLGAGLVMVSLFRNRSIVPSASVAFALAAGFGAIAALVLTLPALCLILVLAHYVLLFIWGTTLMMGLTWGIAGSVTFLALPLLPGGRR